jgi:hypothetical protein
MKIFLYFSPNAANEKDRLCSTKSEVTIVKATQVTNAFFSPIVFSVRQIEKR